MNISVPALLDHASRNKKVNSVPQYGDYYIQITHSIKDFLLLYDYSTKNAINLFLVVNFAGCCILSTSCKKHVNFIKLE